MAQQFTFTPSDQNPDNGNYMFQIGVPFDFTYTLSPTDLANTLTIYPNGFFFVSIMLSNGQFFNLGNGTNDQSDFPAQNVYYQPNQPLDFPNRSYGTSGNYNFNLFFCSGNPNYYVYSIFNTNIQFNDPSCFNEGTKILSLNKQFLEEYIPIEDLRSGDIVKTYKHGYRKIDLIGKQTMINNPDVAQHCMYKMEKTDKNGLLEDFIVTWGHSILVDDLEDCKEINDKLFNGTTPKIDDKYLLLAGVSSDFIKLENTDKYTYYHFTLENNGNDDERFGVWANGILTETPSKKQFMQHNYILL